MELRRVSDSQLEMIYLIRPEHLNGAGRLFGGKLVEWMDELSALVAIRHCRKDVTTVAIDNLRFMCPAYQRDMVVLIGRITHVGTTSMEVRVDVYIEDMNGMRHPINRAYFSVVAMDENERPVEVPGSEFVMELDTVIMSLGTSPNPLISSTTIGLDINKRKCIIADDETGATSKAGVYAGGDAVTGAATVILAMGAGKAAAKGIDEFIKNKAK